MAYINQPPDLRAIQSEINTRLRLLETATRFTAPNVTTDPVNAREGDIWYNTSVNSLRALLTTVVDLVTTGVANTFTALQTFSQGISVANGATITSGNLTVSTGNITATSGTVTGGSGITATTGNITATTGDLIATAGNVTASAGTVSATNLTSTGTTTVGTFNFSTTTTATTVGAAGGASALPATPLGYVIVKIAGTDVKIPYYNM
jgi:hypothetical protein